MPRKHKNGNGNGAEDVSGGIGRRMVNKYHAIPVDEDGIHFDSKKEAARYGELKMLQEVGKISMLECHPRYRLEVQGKLICVYEADFWYHDEETGNYVVEDVKGVKTPVYRIKKKLYEALYMVPITEIT